MFSFVQKFKPKKRRTTLLLDIGNEDVKAMIFQSERGRITVLGSSLEYFDINTKENLISASGNWIVGSEFERNVFKKTILRTADEAKKGVNKKIDEIVVGLAPNILKGKTVSLPLKRKRSEGIINALSEKAIQQKVIKEAKRKLSQIYSQEAGILALDIKFIDFRILEIKIDGYEVPGLRGYEGENLNFLVLSVFLPQYYLAEVENTVRAMGFKKMELIHEIEGLTYCFKNKPDGLFIDVGGEITQLFLVKAGRIENINEFKLGGSIFSQALSERLGIGEAEARLLKEKYSRGQLSKESADRIREILSFSLQTWFQNLKQKLREMSESKLLPSDFNLFGGGSQLSEIKEIIEEGCWDDISFTGKPRVEIIYPKDIIDSFTPSLNFAREAILRIFNSPQVIPLLLIYHAKTQKGH